MSYRQTSIRLTYDSIIELLPITAVFRLLKDGEVRFIGVAQNLPERLFDIKDGLEGRILMTATHFNVTYTCLAEHEYNRQINLYRCEHGRLPLWNEVIDKNGALVLLEGDNVSATLPKMTG